MQRTSRPSGSSRETVGGWTFAVLAAMVFRRWSRHGSDVPPPYPGGATTAGRGTAAGRPATQGRVRPPSAPTLVVFLALAALLWINAGLNHFAFNVAVALVGTLPVAVLLAWAAAGRSRGPAGAI